MARFSWNELAVPPVPRWLRDGKFGLYTHWGVYSVPACGPNASWYAYNMYREGSHQNLHHRLTYGDPADFGYKDLIPLFTADRFDPDEWAELFAGSGARFAGPVAEHHDGFSMWDSRRNPWNAARMGPRRDVVGQLSAALRRRGLKTMVALHHAENWWFYPHWKKGYDVADPQYQGLYGEPHDTDWADEAARLDPNPFVLNHHEFWPRQTRPSQAFWDTWLAKLIELVDGYSPDLVWFDFALKWVPDHYKWRFLDTYYGECRRRGIEGAVTFKWNDLPPGMGIEDIEQGSRADLAPNFWVTDTTVDAGEAWGYVEPAAYKSPATLIHTLIDNVSKNGALLLNVGPRADGTIPEPARDLLLSLGRWLEVNGEGIYGSVPWTTFGEGPTRASGGAFSEAASAYTAQDIRFTVRDQYLYAFVLGRPGPETLIRTGRLLYPHEIRAVTLLGAPGPVRWRCDAAGLHLAAPDLPPGQAAYTFRIERQPPFGGAA